ncbi:MAG: cadmium-translocating P-type ATPase [Desulfurococcales archaeon]|nr:cadmium-translocating P-type ATPase [Desulfurococcales archaeon]
MGLRISREKQRRVSEQYRLVGVHCVSCKRVIEEELHKIPGVRYAEVDPNTGVLRLELEPGADRKAVVEAVRRVGYDVALERVMLRAGNLREGMARKVEEALQELRGVVTVRVFETGKTVRVEIDPETVSVEDLISALKSVGVEAELLETSGEVKGGSLYPLTASAAGAVLYLAGFLLHIPLLEVLGGVLASLVAIKEFWVPALLALRRGYLIMDTLLMLGTLAALILSLYGLAVGSAVYWDAIVFITLFVLAGRALEERLRGKAERLLEEARSLLPGEARVERDGGQVTVKESDVRPGEVVVVRAGEVVPVDGRVLSGRGELDESPITGESKPRPVGEGDLVLAGSTLLRGHLRITALRTGRYRLVARALEAAREAGLYKPRLQELADRVVAVFVPAVVAVAALAVVAHTAIGGGLQAGLLAAATVLVVACPCALGIAIPTAVASAVTRAFRLGAAVRRPDVFEPLSALGAVVFDKTGTLTVGRLRVVDVRVLTPRLTEGEILRLAASLEAESSHPIAKAIIEYYETQYNTPTTRPDEVDEIPGAGMIGAVGGHMVAVGGVRLLHGLDIEEPSIEVEGLTRVYIVVDGEPAAVIGLEDTEREDAVKAIRELKDMGVQVYILSGDSQQAVERLASRVGVEGDNAVGGLDPLDKAEIIAGLKKKHGHVAFIGDGVNDGPALAEASVGVAVREALDVAKQAGDIILGRNDLTLLPQLIKLARKTMRTVKMNLFWAFAYNSLLIPIAAGALEPIGLTITPAAAALAMSLSSITVTANSARLLNTRLR